MLESIINKIIDTVTKVNSLDGQELELNNGTYKVSSKVNLGKVIDAIFVPRPEGYTVNQYCIISTLAKDLEDARAARDINLMKQTVEQLRKYGTISAKIDYEGLFDAAENLDRAIDKVPGLDRYVEKIGIIRKYASKMIKEFIKREFLVEQPISEDTVGRIVSVQRTRVSMKFPGGLYINPDLEYDFNQRLLQVQREQQNAMNQG